jgi:hypothetical protein
MYIVVSKWDIAPGKQEAFLKIGRQMRAFMMTLPEVEFEHAMQCEDGKVMAIVGYSDENAYKEVMAAGGPFETEAKKHDLEGIGTWLWSERGESVDEMATV